MPLQTLALDTLISDLGSVRSASYAAHASGAVRDAIDQAIEEATQALVDTLNTPFDEPRLTRARHAIEVAEDVIAALCEEMMRSERVRRRATDLQGRAREIVDRARTSRG
ncbi:MAG TPA: hypothetical protein VFK70_16510 [Vicinamibacteria bacterium]|nr:hypothetical protein [Vicinamibacteria bacterium]